MLAVAVVAVVDVILLVVVAVVVVVVAVVWVEVSVGFFPRQVCSKRHSREGCL